MLGEPIGIYKFEEKETSPAGADKTFEGPAVKDGTLVIINHASVIDYSDTDRMLCLGRKDGSGEVHYFKVQKLSSLYEAHLEGEMVLLAGEKPIGVVENPNAGEVLYCSFYGLVFKIA